MKLAYTSMVIGGALLFIACKPKTQALKVAGSLQPFASNCGGLYPELTPEEQKEVFDLSEVEDAGDAVAAGQELFTSLSPAVRGYFLGKGGKVQVAASIFTYCGIPTRTGERFTTCLDMPEDTPTIYVAGSSEEREALAENQGLLRLMASFVFRSFHVLTVSSNGALAVSQNAEFGRFLEALGRSYQAEAKGSNEISANIFQELFAANYCSLEARSSFKKILPDTFASFQDLEGLLAKQSGSALFLGKGIKVDPILPRNTEAPRADIDVPHASRVPVAISSSAGLRVGVGHLPPVGSASVAAAAAGAFDGGFRKLAGIGQARLGKPELRAMLNEHLDAVVGKERFSKLGQTFGELGLPLHQVLNNLRNDAGLTHLASIFERRMPTADVGAFKQDLVTLKAEVDSLKAAYLNDLNKFSRENPQVGTMGLRRAFAEVFREETWRTLVKDPYEKGVSVWTKIERDMLPEAKASTARLAVLRRINTIGSAPKIQAAVEATPHFASLKGRLPLQDFEQKLGKALPDDLKSQFPMPARELPALFAEMRIRGLADGLDEVALTRALESRIDEAGSAMFVGGTFGSGKSSSLRKFDITASQALAGDPVKATLLRRSNPQRVEVSSQSVHVEASQVVISTLRDTNADFRSSYLFDGTLRDLTPVYDALNAGKKVMVSYSIVPFQQSAVRVLNRPVGGADPRIPFEEVRHFYSATAQSLERLLKLGDEPTAKGQIAIQVLGPRYDASGRVVDSDGNVPWKAEDVRARLAEYQELAKKIGPQTTVRDLIFDQEGKVSPYFSQSEAQAYLQPTSSVYHYLDEPLVSALNNHAAKVDAE